MYLDDILIATESFLRHLEILKKVFNLAEKHILQYWFDVFFFCYQEVKYVGYLVSERGIQPSSKHVNAMTRDKFLSLASYFRLFIQNVSTIDKPLYDLVKKICRFCVR
jgi:hypothetical protein